MHGIDGICGSAARARAAVIDAAEGGTNFARLPWLCDSPLLCAGDI
eukprot:COSAG02_NODE_3831_length_6175_cov_4.667380_4_plen_46_part_00